MPIHRAQCGLASRSMVPDGSRFPRPTSRGLLTEEPAPVSLALYCIYVLLYDVGGAEPYNSVIL